MTETAPDLSDAEEEEDEDEEGASMATEKEERLYRELEKQLDADFDDAAQALLKAIDAQRKDPSLDFKGLAEDEDEEEEVEEAKEFDPEEHPRHPKGSPKGGGGTAGGASPPEKAKKKPTTEAYSPSRRKKSSKFVWEPGDIEFENATKKKPHGKG